MQQLPKVLVTGLLTLSGRELTKVGFWWSKEESHLPFPVIAKKGHYSDESIENFRKLDELSTKCESIKNNDYVRCVHYRGLSTCRLCNESNGSREFAFNGYTWPEGLAHYVLKHNVVVDEGFVTMLGKHMQQLLDIVQYLTNQSTSSKKPSSMLSSSQPDDESESSPSVESKKLKTEETKTGAPPEIDHHAFHKKMVEWKKLDAAILAGSYEHDKCYTIYRTLAQCEHCYKRFTSVEYNYKNAKFSSLDFHNYFEHGVFVSKEVEFVIANEPLPKLKLSKPPSVDPESFYEYRNRDEH
jgi:hypothetical protein